MTNVHGRSRRQQRWDKQDASRRRVRMTSGRKRRRATVLRFRIGGPATMAWLTVTIALAIVTLIAQTMMWVIFTLVSIAATAAVAKVEARRGGQPTAAPPPRKSQPRPGTTRVPRSGGTAGTPRPTARRPRGSGGGADRCSDACKRSGKPKSTCRCKSSKCQHGTMSGVGGGP